MLEEDEDVDVVEVNDDVVESVCVVVADVDVVFNTTRQALQLCTAHRATHGCRRRRRSSTGRVTVTGHAGSYRSTLDVHSGNIVILRARVKEVQYTNVEVF